jgi:hypothetical protein
VYSPDKPVLELDDHAWTLRAEPVAADEVELLDFERLLHVYDGFLATPLRIGLSA